MDTPSVDHAGNYTSGKLSLPPGSLAPETVAKAVVRLSRRPRNTTVPSALTMLQAVRGNDHSERQFFADEALALAWFNEK